MLEDVLNAHGLDKGLGKLFSNKLTVEVGGGLLFLPTITYESLHVSIAFCL